MIYFIILILVQGSSMSFDNRRRYLDLSQNSCFDSAEEHLSSKSRYGLEILSQTKWFSTQKGCCQERHFTVHDGTSVAGISVFISAQCFVTHLCKAMPCLNARISCGPSIKAGDCFCPGIVEECLFASNFLECFQCLPSIVYPDSQCRAKGS